VGDFQIPTEDRKYLPTPNNPFLRSKIKSPVEYMEFPYPMFHIGSWLALRVSLPASVLKVKFLDSLKKLCESVIAVEHPGTEAQRPHVHFGIYNSVVGHDTFRKKLAVIFKELFPDIGVEGNSLFSVKKWDGTDKYLVYMIKGKHPLIINEWSHTGAVLVSENDYERLKLMWISKTVEENDYIAFKNSIFFPKAPKMTPEEWLASTDLKPPTISFEVVKDACVDYARSFNGGYINSKARFVATNLISNYCLFNRIKILPYRI